MERHNFEIAASAYIDSGVFAVSGRTCAVLSKVLEDKKFIDKYLDEYVISYPSQMIGPLTVDDDNFITRWCVASGYGVRIQYAPEAVVETVSASFLTIFL